MHYIYINSNENKMKKILLILILSIIFSNKSYGETVIEYIYDLKKPEFDCSYKIKLKDYVATYCYNDLPSPINCILITKFNDNFKQLSCFNDNQKINNKNIKTNEEFLKLSLMSLNKNIFSDIFNPRIKEVRNYLEKYKMDCNSIKEPLIGSYHPITSRRCINKDYSLTLFLSPKLESSLIN